MLPTPKNRDARLVHRLHRMAAKAEKDPRARAVLVAATKLLFSAIAFERRHGGHRLFDATRASLARWGRHRARILRDELGIDTNDMADMGRVQDWEDRVFGVTGHFTERSKTSATKCETACPFAKIASGAPEICTDIVHALETATFRELNPRYRLLPLERLLSKGASACEFRHELAAE